MVALLKSRLNKQIRLFEYGSGYSTLFFSGLVGEVVSVECDQQWHSKISRELPKNVRLMFVKSDVDGSYCRAIHQTDGLFDVVVVDGRDRVNCIKQALSKLSKTGIIVLDDSQRNHYKAGIGYAVGQGFKQLDIEGLKPTENGLDTTTILYRSENCFSL